MDKEIGSGFPIGGSDDLIIYCPDCERRAGTEGDMESFNLIGTPGSGWSVCREHCDCVLEPIGYRGSTSISKNDL